MFKTVKRLFQDPDPITVRPEEAHEVFYEHRGDDIATHRETAETHRDRIEDAVAGLEDALTSLEEYQDEKGRAIVEDVVQNFHRERSQALDALEVPEHPEDLHEEITSLSEQFRTMKQKTQAVLQNAVRNKSQVFTELDRLEDRNDELESFLTTDWELIGQYEELTRLVEDLTDHREAIEDLNDQLAETTSEDLEAELGQARDALEAHKDDAVWDELEDLQERKATLREQIDAIRNDLETTRSATERGLKKLVYAAQHGDAELDSDHIDTLQQLRDGTIGDTQDVTAAMNAVTEVLDADTDIMSERQYDRLMNAADRFDSLPDDRERLASLQDDLEDVTDEIAANTAHDEKDRLEDRITRLESKRRSIAEQREGYRSTIRDHEAAIEDITEDIESILEDTLPAPVTVTDPKDETGS